MPEGWSMPSRRTMEGAVLVCWAGSASDRQRKVRPGRPARKTLLCHIGSSMQLKTYFYVMFLLTLNSAVG